MSLVTKKGKQALQDWIQEITKTDCPDFTTYFADGQVFLQVIAHYQPDLVDLKKFAGKKGSEVLDYVFDISAEGLGIDHPLTSGDFVLDDAKKMKEVYKFIGQLFKLFCPNHEIFKKKATTKLGEKKRAGMKNVEGEEDGEENIEDLEKELKALELEEARLKEEEGNVEPTPSVESTVVPVESQDPADLCEECETKVATKFCADCDSKQCDDCADSLHAMKKRKAHAVVPLDQKSEAKPNVEKKKVEEVGGKCTAHPEEKIVAYCKTCDEPICAQCMLKKHDGHTKLDLVTAKPTAQLEFDAILKDLKTTFDSFVSFQGGLNENHKSATEEIRKYFDGIRTAIQKKEESVFAKLKDTHSGYDAKINEEVETLKARISKMEKEDNFVEQLKLKVEAKVEVKRIADENTKLFCDGYLFDFNSTIASTIEKNLDVKPSDAKLTLGKIKGGAKPKVFSTTPTTVDSKDNTPTKPSTLRK